MEEQKIDPETYQEHTKLYDAIALLPNGIDFLFSINQALKDSKTQLAIAGQAVKNARESEDRIRKELQQRDMLIQQMQRDYDTCRDQLAAKDQEIKSEVEKNAEVWKKVYILKKEIQQLKEQLQAEQESNRLLHQAMTSAENRGVEKGREEMKDQLLAKEKECEELKAKIK